VCRDAQAADDDVVKLLRLLVRVTAGQEVDVRPLQPPLPAVNHQQTLYSPPPAVNHQQTLDSLQLRITQCTFSTRFNGRFPGEPGLAGFSEAKDDGGDGDNWSYS